MGKTIDIMMSGFYHNEHTYIVPEYIRIDIDDIKKEYHIGSVEVSIYSFLDDTQKRRLDEGYDDIGVVNLRQLVCSREWVEVADDYPFIYDLFQFMKDEELYYAVIE